MAISKKDAAKAMLDALKPSPLEVVLTLNNIEPDGELFYYNVTPLTQVYRFCKFDVGKDNGPLPVMSECAFSFASFC